MKKLIMCAILMFSMFVVFIQGCQSQQEKEEAIQREKLKKWGKDFTPEKYREKQEKPIKPYWQN